MVDFFSYKGYDHFDSQLVHGFRHDLHQRHEDTNAHIEDHNVFLENAFHQQHARLNVIQTVEQKDLLAELMVWRLISPALNTTMFVHATINNEKVLFVHVPASVQHVATYMGFFVCMQENDTSVLLYEREWHRRLESAFAHIELESAVLVYGVIAIQLLYRSESVGRMSLSYYNSKIRRERNDIMDIVHDSEMIITRLASQTYDRDAASSHFVDIPFAIDHHTTIKSIQHMQEGTHRVCLTTSKERYYFHVMKKAQPLFGQAYTPTFQPWTKSITVLRDDAVPGKEIRAHMDFAEIARVFFSKNVALVKNFKESDTNNVVPPYIQKNFYDRHESIKEARNIDRYLAAAFLMFVVTVQESPLYFVTTNINRWLEELNVAKFIRFLKEKASAFVQGFAYRLFIGYITHGTHNNMTLRSWFVFNPDRRGGVIDKPLINLRAPRGTLFSSHDHIVDLAAHIFVILGIRIGAFDTVNYELYEKCTAACMEAVVITEVLFPRIGFAPLTTTTPTEHSIISDSRLWIAAWLLVFKLIVDRDVQSEKITAIMTIIQEATSDKQRTDSEHDIAVFRRLFCNDNSMPVSHMLGVLVPTIGDIRRHAQKALADLRLLNFTDIFDVSLSTLHWRLDSADISLEDYTPVQVNYSNDIPACSHPTMALGQSSFDLNRIGSVLRKVFSQFYSTKKKFKATHNIIQSIAVDEDLYNTSDDVPAVIDVVVDANEEPVNVYVAKSFDNNARVSKAAQRFLTKARFDVNFLDENEWNMLYWLVCSPIMHQVTETGSLTQNTVLNVKKQSASQMTEAQDVVSCMLFFGSRQTKGMSFCFNTKSLKQHISVKSSTEACINDAVSTRLWDVPVSYGDGQILAKTDFLASRYIEGYPLMTHQDNFMRCRLYGCYSDYVALNNANDKIVNEALLNNLAGTVQSLHQNTFRLRPDERGQSISVGQYMAYLDNLLRFDDDEKYLVRDILSEPNTGVRRQTVPVKITHVLHENEALVAYADGILVPVTASAIDFLGRITSMEDDIVFGETSYGISHFFKFTDYLQTRTSATLLRLLCAAKFLNQSPAVLSPLEYYAPIKGYIYSSIAGKPTLPINTPNSVYARVNNYNTSRRNIDWAAFSPSGHTGRMPVVDAFDDNTMYRMRDVEHENSPYTVQFDEETNQHFLEYADEVEETVLEILAGEISQVEILVHALEPVKKNQEEAATEDLLAYIRAHIFDTEQLYPIDNFAWFQFTSVVSAKSISSNVFDKLPIEEEAKVSPKSKMQRLGARFPTKESAYKKHSSFMLRTLFYKSIEHDIHDLNFKRDFVEFYNQYILSTLPNTDNVYLGSIDDYATIVRYYNTISIDEKSPKDQQTIDALHELSENLIVLPSNVFPNWYVAFFDRSTKYLLIVKSASLGSYVYDRTVYALTKAAEGFGSPVTVITRTVAYQDESVGFFVMLRVIKTILMRENSHLAIEFDSDELETIVKEDNDYSGMIREVVDFIQNSTPTDGEEDPDREYRYSLAIPLSEDEKKRLAQTGVRGYLTDTILTRATAWIHLVYTKENPYPYRLFKILSPLESSLLTNAAHYNPERQPFNSTLTFFPWFIDENHFFLIFVYLPRKIIVALDSLQQITEPEMNAIKRSITKIYAPENGEEYRVAIVKNTPRQQRGDLFRCGDYTVANIEFLVQWINEYPVEFDAAMDDMMSTFNLYTNDQIKQVSKLALSFRRRFMEHIKVDLPDTTAAPSAAAKSDDVVMYDPSSPIYIGSDDEFAGESPVKVHTVDDDPVMIVPPEDTFLDIFDFADETPITQNPLRYTTEPQQESVYPACVVRGYEISAQKFGNTARYVRYVSKEEEATASFVRKTRPAPMRSDEPQLSYWELKAKYARQRGEEVTVAMPPDNNWVKLLASGQPFTQKSRVTQRNAYRASESLVGPSFGLPVRALPLVGKTTYSDSQFVAAAVPLHGARMKTSAK